MRERPLTPPEAHYFPDDTLCCECGAKMFEGDHDLPGPGELAYEGFCSEACKEAYETREAEHRRRWER